MWTIKWPGDPISKFWDPRYNLWTNRAQNLERTLMKDPSCVRNIEVRKVGVAWEGVQNLTLPTKTEYSIITQLNSTTHPPKWVAYKGKKLEAYSYPRSLKRQTSFLLKFQTLLQRKNAAGRLFNASTVLTEKKYLRISKWTCGLYTLSSWPLSSVLAIFIIHAEHVVQSAWILFWLWMYVCLYVCMLVL